MKIAITGATGFLGRYIVDRMNEVGHQCRCWHRAGSDRDGFDHIADLEWSPGELGDTTACADLVRGCDAVVHSGLHRVGLSFRAGSGEDPTDFVRRNLVGTLELIQAAREAGVPRFIFVSTCAVHEKILDDRPLDETHPLWATTHYGAHKAAVEQFVHSFGFGNGYEICAVRPTGIYGLARPATHSKWFDLVQSITRGDPVHCTRGGKEVHAADVATSIELLLHADDIAGEVYSCYDRYVSQWDVARIARELAGSPSEVTGEPTRPRHQIVSDKIKALGMQFGGEERLHATIAQLVEAARGS